MELLGGKVLIADDDPGIVALVEDVLSEEGFEVFAALDGQDGLDAISLYKPDIVLLDLMMPRIDGLEVCRRIRNNPSTSHMCVIMLTARTSPADKLTGLGAGADDYMTKPFDPLELASRVRTAMTRNQETAALSPLTRLPGRRQMQEMETRLHEEGTSFAVLRIDLENLGSFNRYYGAARADMAVRRLGTCVRQVIRDTAGSRGFAGHLGGQEFVAIVDVDLAEQTALRLQEQWESTAPHVYDSDDASRGFIELEEPSGTSRFPLMGLVVAIELRGGTTDAGGDADNDHDLEKLPPILRRSRMGRPPKLWDELATLADGRRGRKKEIWLTESPSTVLIVDDEEDVRHILKLHCEIQGFPVVGEAEDGAQAIALARDLRPAFVILDYRMPGMDGDEAATQIREIDPDVKIIAFSGMLSERPAWADDFLSKEQIAQITPLLTRFRESGAAPPHSRR